MPLRPPRLCAVPTCPSLATVRGRCEAHRADYLRSADLERGSASDRGLGADWRKLRIRILDRDHWTCRKCFSPATEVDHVMPRARARALGWSKAEIDAGDNLQSLCHDCHAEKSAQDRAA